MTATTRATYRATVTRGQRYWLIVVDGVGATQARRLSEVEHMARDLVHMMLEVPADSFDLTVDRRLSEVATSLLAEAEAHRAQAAAEQALAARLLRQAARELHDTEGLPLRDVGTVLGVSYQRAHQLVADPA